MCKHSHSSAVPLELSAKMLLSLSAVATMLCQVSSCPILLLSGASTCQSCGNAASNRSTVVLNEAHMLQVHAPVFRGPLWLLSAFPAEHRICAGFPAQVWKSISAPIVSLPFTGQAQPSSSRSRWCFHPSLQASASEHGSAHRPLLRKRRVLARSRRQRNDRRDEIAVQPSSRTPAGELDLSW